MENIQLANFTIGEITVGPIFLHSNLYRRGDVKGTIGVCCYDFSSTTLILSEFSDFLSYSRLLSKLETLSPDEISSYSSVK
ncbi:unnamed protein product [Rotaria magnacalcarata]